MTLIVYKELPDPDFQTTENIYYLIVIVVRIYNPDNDYLQIKDGKD